MISDRRAILLMSNESALHLEKLLKAHMALVRESVDLNTTMERRHCINNEISQIRIKRNEIIELEKIRILQEGMKRTINVFN